MDKDKDMSRRRFLKMAALTGVAMCVGPTLNKVINDTGQIAVTV